ncbi:MAG: META domain-containing protein [Actinomycetota bacterium]|nr:META domain-containing protein [Actinomycetota bacterium]
MPETWIDEHTGDETIARPDFRAALRADLAKELATGPTRRTPWKAIGWASVAAAAAVTTVVVVGNDNPDGRVIPGDTTQVTTDVTTGVPSSLRGRLVDVVWLVTTIDGVEVVLDPPPSFTLQNTGRLVGFDGCNQYGFAGGAETGGWTLDGDIIRLDQQVVSTAMACVDVPEPILPVGDGTRVEFAPETGVLTLFHPDGTVYTAESSTGEVPVTEELVIPAAGGPLLAPTPLVTLVVPTVTGAPLVALLPDRIVVLTMDPFTLDGSVTSFDRSGNALPETTLDPVPDGQAGLVLGGRDRTLYIVTNSETENTQTVRAYQLDGDVWREVDSTVVEQNNDGVYALTGDGLVLGDTVVLPAPTPDPSAPETGWIVGDDGTQVFRNDSDGSITKWNIVEQFENFSIPSAVYPFGDGAIYVGNASGTDEQRYIGILRPDGGSEFFRPDGWMLSGVDGDTALFVKAVDGQVTLAVLGGAPQIGWAAGTVLGFPIGFSDVDKVLTGVNTVLGEPTADSGWFVVEPIAPGDEDCLAGVEVRVLHWGDLAVAFKKANTADGLAGELMWSWVVGDLRGSGFDSYREPASAPAGTPTGLRTEDGFGVGTSIDELRTAGEVTLSDFTNDDGSRNGTFVPADGADGASFRGLVVDADGIVIGFGTTQAFC